MSISKFTARHFFGRKREMDILQDIAARALSDDAGSVLLFGRRGIGKSALLKNLFSELFSGQSGTIPFLYSVNTAFSSVDAFSRDYLSSLVIQSLAFLKKDASLIHSGMYSLEDIKDIAGRAEAPWAVDVIDAYIRIREADDPMKLFSFAVSAPVRMYRASGMPVMVLVDDFHQLTSMSEYKAGVLRKDMWMYFERSMNVHAVPHVLAGVEADLRRMFFEETTFGEHLEVMNLDGLNRDESSGLFHSLCEKFRVTYESGIKNNIEVFRGNPFYITSYIQAVRQRSESLGADNFWDIYTGEITRGKIGTYWTSILKRSISRFESRKPALQVLYHLFVNNSDDTYRKLPEIASVQREELDRIIDLLHLSGALEAGFSTVEPVNDRVLADVVTGLYEKEINRESGERIREILTGDRVSEAPASAAPVFDMTLPATAGAESLAVRTLEQIAGYFTLPPDATGQLQVSLAALFSAVLRKGELPGAHYQLAFSLRDNVFSVEVMTAQKYVTLTEEDRKLISPYVDDIKGEETMDGTRIILLKRLREDPAVHIPS